MSKFVRPMRDLYEQEKAARRVAQNVQRKEPERADFSIGTMGSIGSVGGGLGPWLKEQMKPQCAWCGRRESELYYDSSGYYRICAWCAGLK